MSNFKNLTGNSSLALSLIAILGTAVALTATPLPVYAAGVVGTGTAASCTEAALDTALKGGGNVTFKCGTQAYAIAISKEKSIAANTTIDGGNLITLNGGNKTRVLVVGNGIKLTLTNLTIANGFSTQQGAGIFSGNKSQLTVTNCKFNNNISTSGGTFDGGGAIFISSESTATIQSSTFTSNKAGNGGAINNLLSNLTVSNSTFTSNESTRPGAPGGGGGAIYIDGGNGGNGKLSITGSTFSKNKAVFQGGAIFIQLYNNDAITIDKSTIADNIVNGSGNQGFGGGIFIVAESSNSNFTLTNTTLARNTATNQGGGLWTGNQAKVIITNSTIYGNQAMSADGKGGLGGGIMRTGGTIEIRNTTIASNIAGFQGGGIYGDGSVKITNTIIANNVAKNGGNNWNIKNNCSDTLSSAGSNLQFPAKNAYDASDKDCASNIVTADPKLDSLKSNGGSTQTAALLQGSAAIDAGDNALCPKTDQIGTARPQGSKCDLGAFEFK